MGATIAAAGWDENGGAYLPPWAGIPLAVILVLYVVVVPLWLVFCASRSRHED